MNKKVFKAIEKYKLVGSVLEIGSDRFEGSTRYLYERCKSKNISFYSVDCEKGAYNRAKSIGSNAYLSTGENFIQNILPTLNIKFSFVFLDNFDFLIPGFNWEHEDAVRSTYVSLGMTLNNVNSQKAHFDQAQLIQPYLNDSVIIAFDDTWQKSDGNFDGKGGTAIPWLLVRDYFVIEQGPIGDNIVGGYVILARTFVKIRAIACCKNEDRMLPFFLQYYSAICDEIILYDGNSTDKSLEIIARYSKAKVISSGNDIKMDERQLTGIRNNEYKKDRSNWDWQIIVDVDEFIYHPNLMQKLKEYKLLGITIPRTDGYEMVSFNFPIYDQKRFITNQIKNGYKNNDWQAKKAIFNPKEIDINYQFGCHACSPKGNIVTTNDREIKILHYSKISYDHFIKKYKANANRLCDFNKDKQLAYHIPLQARMSEEEFNLEIKKSYNVIDDEQSIQTDNLEIIIKKLIEQPKIYGNVSRLKIDSTAIVNNATFNLISGNIIIKQYVFFGHNVSLLTGTHDYSKFNKERQQSAPNFGHNIIIEEGAWISSNATILGPCIIGEHSVVAACALVNSDVPPYSVVAGVPAKVIQNISKK